MKEAEFWKNESSFLENEDDKIRCLLCPLLNLFYPDPFRSYRGIGTVPGINCSVIRQV